MQIGDDFRIGIDLGGTKIEAILLDRDGIERARRRIATPASAGYDATIGAIRGLVDELEAEFAIRPPAPVGIGMPGAISPATGLVKNANSVFLNGRPFDRDVAAALGRPVRVANDADCLAVSEATDGAGAGADSVFAAILGTGVGGGLVVAGRPLRGPNAVAGEWGHNPCPGRSTPNVPAPPAIAGGRAASRRSCPARASRGTSPATTPWPRWSGHSRRGRIRRPGGGGGTRSLCRPAGPRPGDGHQPVRPHAIVLGGGLSRIDRLYTDVPARWGDYVFRTGSLRRCGRPGSATPAACVVRPGCGHGRIGSPPSPRDRRGYGLPHRVVAREVGFLRCVQPCRRRDPRQVEGMAGLVGKLA